MFPPPHLLLEGNEDELEEYLAYMVKMRKKVFYVTLFACVVGFIAMVSIVLSKI